MLRALGDELGPDADARATSTSGAARCRRSRSTGTRSARSRARSARRATTSRWGRSGSSARSTTGRSSRGRSAGCPSSPTGRQPGARAAEMLTEWQVYRMFDSRRGAWATFQFLVRKRLLDEGAEVRTDGTLGPTERLRPRRRSSRAASGRSRAPAGPARRAADRSRRSRSVRKRARRTTRPAVQGEERPLVDLPPAQPQAAVAPDDLRARARSRRRATPSRHSPSHSGRADTAGEVEHAPARARRARPRPSRRGAPRTRRASLRECAASANIASESTVISGSVRAHGCSASSSSSLTMIPLWMPTTGPCRTGWLLAAIDGWPFV